MSAVDKSLKKLFLNVRQHLLKSKLGRAGKHLQFDRGIRFEQPRQITLEDGVRIGRHALLRANTKFRISIGEAASILEDTMLTANGGEIHIGARSWVGAGSYLYGNGGIHIGADVLIAARTVINTVSHNYADRTCTINSQGLNTAPVIIEDDVWIGLNCTILQGVTIGRGAIVGAGTLVNCDIPAYSIAVGTPARIIGTRPGLEALAA
ncbi:MAG: acyltransferase [Pseudomonadales bacterium]|nr:acyltransferase [Pseudomonadales bacterium]MDP4640868.1 acyltransferase [Pseudomonadales bacterium]